MTNLLPCIEIEPKTTAKASIIWLHGLGADGHDFESIVPELNLPDKHQIRFVFPNAPSRAITINAGYVMPAWFDIVDINDRTQADDDGIKKSIAQLTALIKRENERGIDTNNIVLAGFSQGGVIAIHTALRHTETLGGLMALSTYLPNVTKLNTEKNTINDNIPIFLAHGKFDPVLPFELGLKTKTYLEKTSDTFEWHEYAMEHSVCLEEIQDISKWLFSLPALKTALHL